MSKVFGLVGLVLAFTLVLASLCPLPAWAMDATLERDILEVIAQHPDAIAHALQSYQQQQAKFQQQIQNQVLEQVKQNLPGFIARSPIRGDKTAKVMLVEFADFQCPFCAKAHAPIQALLDRHPEVAFVFKHLPLTEIHANAMPAAQAAWAAGQQGQFWQYYDRLFEQADVLGESLYKVIAQELHLNPAKFNHDRLTGSCQSGDRGGSIPRHSFGYLCNPCVSGGESNWGAVSIRGRCEGDRVPHY